MVWSNHEAVQHTWGGLCDSAALASSLRAPGLLVRDYTLSSKNVEYPEEFVRAAWASSLGLRIES